MSLANTTPANIARAAIEGLLCGLADGIDALVENGVEVGRVLLVGGGARSEAVQQIAPTIFPADVEVPEPGEYVALGAAAQAARAVNDGAAPDWPRPPSKPMPGELVPHVREQYRAATDRIATA
jgi:xylulokinase